MATRRINPSRDPSNSPWDKRPFLKWTQDALSVILFWPLKAKSLQHHIKGAYQTVFMYRSNWQNHLFVSPRGVTAKAHTHRRMFAKGGLGGLGPEPARLLEPYFCRLFVISIKGITRRTHKHHGVGSQWYMVEGLVLPMASC